MCFLPISLITLWPEATGVGGFKEVNPTAYSGVAEDSAAFNAASSEAFLASSNSINILNLHLKNFTEILSIQILYSNFAYLAFSFSF